MGETPRAKERLDRRGCELCSQRRWGGVLPPHHSQGNANPMKANWLPFSMVGIFTDHLTSARWMVDSSYN